MCTYVRHTLVALAWLMSAIEVGTILGGGDAAASKVGWQTGTEASVVETAANQAPGQSEPGGRESVADETGQPGSPDRPLAPAGWTAYVDSTHGFSISYPNGFVVQRQNVSTLARFTPTPVTSMFFMNPTMAAGGLAGIEPPDLEVRVYQAEAVKSLKSWLVSMGVASADSGAAVQPYRNASVSGLEVCQSTMIAPGCSVYVLGGGRVYQLTPISREGEAMILTFALRA